MNGLASEKVRWAESVERMKKEELMLPGDVLLTSAYISYVGCFSRNYRTILLEEKWLPFFKSLNVRIFYNAPVSINSLLFFIQPSIPLTEDLDVLSLLTDPATIAHWNNENLPNDRMSIENATILTNAERWPLMIDPQLQGIKWIKTREGEELKVVRLGAKG